MPLQILKPGTPVNLSTPEGDIAGFVSGCMIRFDHVVYQVAWWSAGERNETMLERFEFEPASEEPEIWSLT